MPSPLSDINIIPLQPRPNKDEDRVAWNASWERDVSKMYSRWSGYNGPSLVAQTCDHLSPLHYLVTDAEHMELESQVKSLCDLQQDIAQFAIIRLAEEDFEGQWKAMDDARRGEHVLEGIYRASTAADMEQDRQWTPELNVERLSSAKGKRYLDVLKQLLPDDADRPITEPTLIPNPILDKVFEFELAELEKMPSLRMTWKIFFLRRTFFLSLAVWNILLSFYGRREEYVTCKGPRSSMDSAAWRKAAAKTLGKKQLHDLEHEARKLVKDSRKNAVNICWHCGRDESRLEPGQRLLLCSRCHGIGRKIWFCSRDCQARNYKEGIPRPHKVICGKSFDDGYLSANISIGKHQKSNDENDRFLPPRPWFKQQPALLHQITLLKEHPHVDYFLLCPPSEDDWVVEISNSCIKRFFLTMRQRAMQSGDYSSVLHLYNILTEITKRGGLSQAELKRQLENEYGVSLP